MNNNIKTINQLCDEYKLSSTIIKSLIVDYDVPCVQIGDNRDSLILVNGTLFDELFNNINVDLRLRVQDKRRKNREKCRSWYNENYESEILKSRERANKYYNTFCRVGNNRGDHGMLKRDYELSDYELEKRNRKRISRNKNVDKRPCYGLLVWYSGDLDNLSSYEYSKQFNKEYMRQKRCAIVGSVGKTKPFENFLFDFDLEKMLEGSVYVSQKNERKYITKWWKGEIRHWTVNDGIWRN